MLLDTCLLAPSAGDFYMLSCMLKTVSIQFLHIVFCLYFFIFLRYSSRKLMFLLDISVLLGLCFDSGEIHLSSIQKFMLIYVSCLQALRRYLQFSVGKSPAKTLSLFILTKGIKSIFSANQKAAFLRILQIAAP